ncbi:uncharacterized protein ARMOST_07702 [Armillaria ostoyae]|uniref:Uncharacterized protein n=1 Tax=Armillaria ostoyae TaxID=47428 RepID=A0A284R6J3_ARMOS|nr:uncharacterized protein ARMOST_07702 [Armillaria ostoyae]
MNNRDLRARYDSFPPPAYDPASFPPLERALVPIHPCPIMGFPTMPAQHIFIQPPSRGFPDDSSSEDDMPWNRAAPPAHHLPPLINSSPSTPTTRTSTPSTHQTPTPMSQSPSLRESHPESPPHSHDHSPLPTKGRPTHSTSTPPTTSGTSSPPSIYLSSALTAPPPGSYAGETLRLGTISQEMTEPQWAGTSQWNKGIQSQDWVETQPSQQGYSITRTGTTMAPPQGTYYGEGDANKPQENRSSWSSLYSNWPLNNGMRMPPSFNQFDTFNYDQETFGGYTPELSRDYQGYTMAPYYPNTPLPLPDASPHQIRQHGQYHSPKTSRLYAGTNDGAGGSNDIPVDPPNDPPVPSWEECLQEAKVRSEENQQEVERLCLQLQAAQAKRSGHDMIWNLNQEPDKEEKQPECG